MILSQSRRRENLYLRFLNTEKKNESGTNFIFDGKKDDLITRSDEKGNQTYSSFCFSSSAISSSSWAWDCPNPRMKPHNKRLH